MATDRPDGADDFDDQDKGKDANPFEDLFALFNQMPGFSMPGSEPGSTPGQPPDLNQLMSQLQDTFARMGMTMPGAAPASASGVSWDFIKDIARKVVASLGADPVPSVPQERAAADAARLADLWLGEATVFEASPGPRTAWSRAEWVEGTMPVWQQLVEPVVSSIAAAMSGLMGDEDDPQLASMQAMLAPMMRTAAGNMFGAQVGQALGRLGTEVLTATEIGLPLTSPPGVHVLPTSLAAFSEGLDVSEQDVVIYLTLREAARQRLFAEVGWLGPQLLGMINHYAREITIDRSAIEDAFSIDDMNGLSMERMQELGQQLSGKLFTPQRTPEQTEILGRLETLLALAEGWVDEVVSRATARWMPNATSLAEVVRRRRASGGPAEQVFATLVGLELRPRRVRDAATLWAALTSARGIEGRDAVWQHPDLLPTAPDLDDPLGFVSGDRAAAEPDDMDAELAKLLDEEAGKDDPNA